MHMRETIKIRTPNGREIHAFEGDSITHQIQKHGEYDKNALDSIREVLAIIKPVTSLDIGANIGNHSLVIATLSQRLFAFEPVGFVHTVLQKNLLENRVQNAVAVNVGLSSESASKTIFVPKMDNVGCSSLDERGLNSDRHDIRLITGDEYLATNGIRDVDFIKMDIEGHEGEAIEGLKTTIRTNQPLLLMEWDQRTAHQFAAHQLFDSVFAGYSAFSVSRTDNKKMHPKTFFGSLRRLWYRLTCRSWCLSKFDPTHGYRNIYLVPDRYRGVFSNFRYLSEH